MPEKLHTEAWKLYHACFKDGDDVIVIDEDDTFFWGELETHDSFCVLRRKGKRNVQLDWVDVAFISHDGFPVQKMLESSKAIAALEKTAWPSVAERVRRLLTGGVCGDCGVLVERDTLKYGRYEDKSTGEFVGRLSLCPKCRRKVRIKRGDPWRIEGVTGRLFWPGNAGPEHWVGDEEEIVVLRASDGAWAHVWGVQSFYELEVA